MKPIEKSDNTKHLGDVNSRLSAADILTGKEYRRLRRKNKQ